MTVSRIGIVLLAASVSALAGQTIAVLRSHPLPSLQEMANLESRVLQNPEDIDARVQILQFYLDTAPPAAYENPGRRSVRLQHILYLVERHPEAASSASKAAYVYRANGPYANVGDHEAVRDQWLAAVQGHPKNNAVTLNAVRFLLVEDPSDAEQVLRRAVDSDPENREIAANLGFQYAREILFDAPDLATHATAELEQSSNAIVLAAAGTALPNMMGHGGSVNEKLFDLASELTDRARKLAPDDPDIQGPMPLIKYFVTEAPQPASTPSRIRVGENVQNANLIGKTQPQRPAGTQLSGEVRFTAIIGRDGTIQHLELISGHPLLAQPAMQAVKTWLYKPTLLNGAPVEVVTTITVSFPAN